MASLRENAHDENANASPSRDLQKIGYLLR